MKDKYIIRVPYIPTQDLCSKLLKTSVRIPKHKSSLNKKTNKAKHRTPHFCVESCLKSNHLFFHWKQAFKRASCINTKSILMIKDPIQFEREKLAIEECINSQDLQRLLVLEMLIWVFLPNIKLGNSFWKLYCQAELQDLKTLTYLALSHSAVFSLSWSVCKSLSPSIHTHLWCYWQVGVRSSYEEEIMVHTVFQSVTN